MPHIHRIYDTDKHFIIDPISRNIISEAEKVTLMQYDHLSERFTFEVPRFIEGHDMSLSTEIQVHYININGSNKRETSNDIYTVDDVQLSPDSDDMVCFSWLISKTATKFAGTLTFAVRFVCFDGSEIIYQWLTSIFTNIKIGTGVFNTESIFEEYKDIVEAWKESISVLATETAMNANISKLNADTAVKSADNANLSATNAAKSEQNAATSASDASNAAANATQSMTNAAKSEQNAAASASDAASSVTKVGNLLNNTKFAVNFDTGKLEYVSTNFDFKINAATGNLEWEVR